MMPQLRCEDSHEAHFDRDSLQPAFAERTCRLTPVGDSWGVEVSRLGEGLGANELLDERRFGNGVVYLRYGVST